MFRRTYVLARWSTPSESSGLSIIVSPKEIELFIALSSFAGAIKTYRSSIIVN